MKNEISLNSALAAWESEYFPAHSLLPHLQDEELQQLPLTAQPARMEQLEHLSRCSWCVERYRMLQQEQAVAAVQSWAIIYRKAAATSAKVYPLVYHSPRGEYRIEILKSTDGGEGGLVILTLLDRRQAEASEGTLYLVCDASGKTLIRGKIVNSRALQQVTDLEQIDDRNFLIRPLAPPESRQNDK